MTGDPEPPAPAQAPDRRMLESLVCPVTHAMLTWDPVRRELVSRAANLAFPVRDGIPVMLVSEARPLE
jgi:uncharacterized protein YbaR (Trm112 family)